MGKKMENFNNPTDENTEFWYNYQVLCGVEEEFLIINNKGTLVEAADEIMMKAAEILEKDTNLLNSLKIKIRGLDAEPSPTQIEYVTLPLPPSEIENAIIAGRQLLIKSAELLGVKILAQSLHPIQSDPHPIVGTHINISVQRKGYIMTPEEIRAVYNYLWNYLPEIIAYTGNSPIYQGNFTNFISNRLLKSRVLKPNGPAKIKVPENKPALVPMRYYGRMRYTLRIGTGEDEFAKSVIANPKGDRLMDITPRGPSTNIGADKDDSPTRNRVEIRVIDVQQDHRDLIDLVFLCCASALHALALDRQNQLNIDSHHDINLKSVLEQGKNALLKRNNKKITVEESLSDWFEKIKHFQEVLGIKMNIHPIEKLNQEPLQKELKIKYNTRNIENLRRQGKKYAIVQLNSSRIVKDKSGRTYKVNSGAQLNGTLSVDYNLSFNERDGIVTNFNSINIINVLNLQDLKIPLKKEDHVLSAMTETEYLTRSFLGNFLF